MCLINASHPHLGLSGMQTELNELITMLVSYTPGLMLRLSRRASVQ